MLCISGQNLEDYLKNAIETKTVNYWMIAVSPTISFEYVSIYG